MTRRLLLLDVTQVSGSSVCVAGLDVDSGENVRLADPQPTRALLRRLGGLVPGELVELDFRKLRRPTPPHTEDAQWRPQSLKRLRALVAQEIASALAPHALRGVEEAFGARILPARGNTSWAPGRGERSLATLQVKYIRCSVDARGKPRVAFRDASNVYCVDVPLQDFRVKTHFCERCEPDASAVLREEFNADQCLVRVGLTRPFSPDGRPAACWLQVTNIFARARTHFV